MEWPSAPPGEPIILDSNDWHRQRKKSDKKARFAYDVNELLVPAAGLYRRSAKHPGSRRPRSSHRRWRRSSHGHGYYDDDYTDNDWGEARARDSDSISDATDPDLFMNARETVPSLTFHFKFNKSDAGKDTPNSSAPKSSQHSSHQEAKNHRLRLYHENIFSVISSRYVGDIRGRESDASEAVLDYAPEKLERKSVELYRWM